MSDVVRQDRAVTWHQGMCRPEILARPLNRLDCGSADLGHSSEPADTVPR
jgi:hypothetical protein